MGEDKCLSTAEGLRQLVEELQALVNENESPISLKDVLQAFSVPSSILWWFLILSMAIIASLVACPAPFGNTQACGLLLLLIFIFNILLAISEAKKKKSEIATRLRWCIANLTDFSIAPYNEDPLSLDKFEKLLKKCETAGLLSSPSHGVTYVYKKENGVGVIRPIPTSLLATGDHISLWSGQTAPATVVCLKDKFCHLARGSVFSAQNVTNSDCASDNAGQVSYRFEVRESPVINDIKNYLLAIDQHDRNNIIQPTVFERQRNYLLEYLLKYIIFGILILTYVISAMRISLIPHPTSTSSQIDRNLSVAIRVSNRSTVINIPVSAAAEPLWHTYFLKIPALLCLPLYPILLHALCTMLVAIGEAKTLAVCHFKEAESMKYMPIPNTLTMSSQAMTMQNETMKGARWWSIFRRLMLGKDGTIMYRNAGLFLPLGSLTVLCCLDKEGILSWFNPIAEKVFFFKRITDEIRKEISTEEIESAMPLIVEEEQEQNSESNFEGKNDASLLFEDQKVISETLSLSQDLQDPSCVVFFQQVRFDDVRWKDHHSSLKAIGLNIVLNLCSCSNDRQTSAMQGYRSLNSLDLAAMNNIQNGDDELNYRHKNELHLHSIAADADCLPTGTRMVRKGLCDLAGIIGISQCIKKAYVRQKTFMAYRKPIQQARLNSPIPEHYSGAQFRRNKWKQYLPCLQGTLFEDLVGDKQMLVFGTGDAIIEQCKEIWDGHEIQLMTLQDRRKALDFYQRSSVAGHCIAFAYSPVPLHDSDLDVKCDGKNHMVNLSNCIERKKLSEDLGGEEVLSNMIFLGMTTLQHQARFAVCHMVDALDQACIRFVHFSSDNEVRSRVFAEKMGLETGWNCHISLSSSPTDVALEAKTSQFHNRSESSKSRSSSEGGAFYRSKPMPEEDELEDLASPSSQLIERLSPRTQSESSTTDSLFNVSNRAKLPRGIKNIVPHIENVDNVPLLVPLFTDATADTAAEMIEIMKKYGENVCCIGSSDCIRNMVVFSRANVSIAIEPVLQQSSNPLSEQSNLPSCESLHISETEDSDEFMALEVARNLNCFACSALLSGDNGLPVIMNMITQARHFLFLIRTFFIFLGKCQLALTLLQLVAHAALLPSPFTAIDVFWLSIIVFPLLSLTLLRSSPDQDMMTWANEKTLPDQSPVIRSTIKDAYKRFLVKFVPSVLVLVACYALALQSCCIQFQVSLKSNEMNSSIVSNSTTAIHCYPNFMVTVTESSGNFSSTNFRQSIWDGTDKLRLKFRAIQMTIACFLVVYICLISMGYVHRWKKLPDASPFSNKSWWLTVLFLILIQLLGAFIVLLHGSGWQFSSSEQASIEYILYGKHLLDFGPLQVVIWAILCLWIVPCAAFNELWKWREIKMWNRWQKRARLSFGTKLGMNSPF